jgi:hypothetical protein
MTEAVGAYIRSQGIGAAVGNVVINPALAWVANRQVASVAVSEVVIDTAITCVIMALIVTLITARGTRRELDAGRISGSESFPPAGGVLSWLPRRGWALGLTLGLGAAVVMAPLTLGVMRFLGVEGLSLVGFALFKAVWTPLLAVAVVRWVVLRQLMPVPTA